MKTNLEHTKWIWCNNSPQKDEYAEFVQPFIYQSGKAILQISADSNYAAYINGQLAAWGQYADFPYDKVYDEVDVTEFCHQGENRLAILVWYYGMETSSVYYPGNASLLFRVLCNDQILCQSDSTTLCRISRAYQSHRCKIITTQLGYSYTYDATKEDDWLTGQLNGFSPAIIVDQNLPLRIRPCNKLTLPHHAEATFCKRISDTDEIYDLGKEQVGFLTFVLNSPCQQNITISYGEHLVDGVVRRIIGDRDFSVEYQTTTGHNAFFNPFRRLGCRYLQIQSEYPLDIKKIAIAPTMYVLQEQPRPPLSPLQNKIYDMCVETLHLCMHEHYEDCPWREQALYTMDSRNQMLCGYHAFGEYRFPRSNIELIAKDNRSDGLLSICYPIKWDWVIPSFSLHYITQCREYMEYSGDTAFLQQIYPKLASIMEAFLCRIENGLVKPFEGNCYWNFYEWTENLDNWGLTTFPNDLLINAMFSIALKNMAIIADKLGIENTYLSSAAELNDHIRSVFWDKEKRIFYNYSERSSYSQLGNALAILCGAICGNDAELLCEKILSDHQMTDVSLSMRCFLYDALLMVDREKYSPVILKDIETIYTPMIEFGSTTVWETELGESDFASAGSLCHGWSAMPIYYFHTLIQ